MYTALPRLYFTEPECKAFGTKNMLTVCETTKINNYIHKPFVICDITSSKFAATNLADVQHSINKSSMNYRPCFLCVPGYCFVYFQFFGGY